MIETCIFADEVSKDFDESVRLSVDAGARCIEVRGGVWNKHIRAVDDNDVERMKEVLAKYGARISVVGANVGKCDMEDHAQCAEHVAEFERMAELAHVFGTDVIRGFAMWNPGRRAKAERTALDDAILKRVVERLRPVIDIAERENVVFAIESEESTMGGSCEELRRIVDAFSGSPGIAITWDINNSRCCGSTPYPDGYELVKDHLRHIHVKPNKDKNIQTIWDFPMSYEELLKIILRDGYRGSAGIEHWGSPELMLEGARQLSAVLRRIQ